MAALERFGRLDRAAVFQPAIDLAEHGWPITSFGARMFAEQQDRLGRYPSSRATYFLNGRPPREGERRTAEPGQDLPDAGQRVAPTRSIAASLGTSGPGGPGRRRLAHGGRPGRFTPVWHDPLAIDFHGYRVHLPPPPSLGFQTLESLQILDDDDLEALGHNSADYLHLLLETIKLASADRTRYAAAPADDQAALLDRSMPPSVGRGSTRAAPLRAKASATWPTKTGEVRRATPRYARDHTTHFEVGRPLGNLVTVTQSNGAAFGSGFVAATPASCSTTSCTGPTWTRAVRTTCGRTRRAKCSMSPCIVTRGDGKPVLGIGTPGLFGILQTTLQMLLNRLVFGMQRAGEHRGPAGARL